LGKKFFIIEDLKNGKIFSSVQSVKNQCLSVTFFKKFT